MSLYIREFEVVKWLLLFVFLLIFANKHGLFWKIKRMFALMAPFHLYYQGLHSLSNIYLPSAPSLTSLYFLYPLTIVSIFQSQIIMTFHKLGTIWGMNIIGSLPTFPHRALHVYLQLLSLEVSLLLLKQNVRPEN